MKAVIYARISKEEAEGEEVLGITRQLADCAALVESKGWELLNACSDNVTASGRKPRPCWERTIMPLIESGEVDVLVSYDSSRLYRNYADLDSLILYVKGHPEFKIATIAGGEIDLSTADGIMMAEIKCAIDKNLVAKTAERTKRAKLDMKAKGLFLGGPRPFGYDVVGDKKTEDKPRLVPNAREAKAIQGAAEDILNGVSLGTIAKGWNAKEIRTPKGSSWNARTIGLMFSRSQHSRKPGILSDLDVTALAHVFDKRRTDRAPRYMLSGILRCEKCERGLVGKPAKGIPRYVCMDLRKPGGGYELGILARPTEFVVGMEAVKRHLVAPRGLVDLESPLLAQGEALRAKQKALGERFVAGDLSESAFFAADAAITAELKALDNELAAVPPDVMQVQISNAWEEASVFAEDLEVMGAGGKAHYPPWSGSLFSNPAFDELTRSPEVRAWVESLIEKVVVSPSKRGANTFDPSRIEIHWRANVSLRA